MGLLLTFSKYYIETCYWQGQDRETVISPGKQHKIWYDPMIYLRYNKVLSHKSVDFGY